MTMELDTILCGDSLNVLKALPESSVHCCVTSPPYYGLRDYAKTNAREYFADCFAYWVKYAENANAISLLQECAPMTYRYMEDLMRIANRL